MMITEHESTLPKQLYSISVSIEPISRSYMVYLAKLFHTIGVNPNSQLNSIRKTITLSPLTIAALSYFKCLIKHIRQDDVYLNLHMTFLLTKPCIKEYSKNVLFFKCFYGNSIGDDILLYSAYYNQFSSKQTILALKNYVNTEINMLKIAEDIDFIFGSQSLALESMVNELEYIVSFYNHFYRHYRHYAKNKVISGLTLFSVLFSPSTYTQRLSQCKDAIMSINPYSSIQLLCKAYQSNYNGISSVIYSNVYQPFEHISVYIRDTVIAVQANISSSSLSIKDSIVNYVAGEIGKIKDHYGSIAASVNKSKSSIDITVPSQVVNMNRNWFKLFLEQINSNFFYAKAKDVIGNIYLKWLLPSCEDDVMTLMSVIDIKEGQAILSVERTSLTFLSMQVNADNEDEDEAEVELHIEEEDEEEFKYECNSMVQLGTDKGKGLDVNISNKPRISDSNIDQINQSNDDSIKDYETQSLSINSIELVSSIEQSHKQLKRSNNPFAKKKKKKIRGIKNLQVCLNEIH